MNSSHDIGFEVVVLLNNFEGRAALIDRLLTMDQGSLDLVIASLGVGAFVASSGAPRKLRVASLMRWMGEDLEKLKVAVDRFESCTVADDEGDNMKAALDEARSNVDDLSFKLACAVMGSCHHSAPGRNDEAGGRPYCVERDGKTFCPAYSLCRMRKSLPK